MSNSPFERFEKALLESGAREAPSAARRTAARAAVMRAAGVGAAAVAASLATTKTAAAVASVAPAPIAGAGALKVTLLVKVALLCAVAAVVVGGAAMVRSREAHERDRPGVVVTPAKPASSVAAAEPVAPAVDVSALPAAPPAASAKPASSAKLTPPAAADAVDPVAAEARLLEAARRCLTAGDRTCARAKLAEHRARFSDGALREEARVLEGRLARSPGEDR